MLIMWGENGIHLFVFTEKLTFNKDLHTYKRLFSNLKGKKKKEGPFRERPINRKFQVTLLHWVWLARS